MTHHPSNRRLARILFGRTAVLGWICLAASAAVVLLARMPFSGAVLQRAELRLADQIHNSGRLGVPSADVVVLGIDDASLTLEALWPEDLEASEALRLMAEGWPWSRKVWALLVDRLMLAGARTVVLDLTFGAPSNPADDAALRAALARYPGRVVVGVDHQDRGRGAADFELILPAPGVLPDGADFRSSMGLLNFWPDQTDGVVRTQRALWTRSDPDPSHWVQSLALAILRQQGGEAVGVIADANQPFRFRPMASYAPLSLYEVFVESLWESNYGSGSFFEGKTVFVGAAARHFQDELETPIGRIFGVQAHAHALDALRSGDWLWEVSSAVVWLILGCCLLGVWVLVTRIKRPFLLLCLLAAGVVLGFQVQRLMHDRFSLILPLQLPMLGSVLAGVFSLGYDFVLERRRRRDLLRYFSPDMASELSQNPAPYLQSLGGVNRVVTLLFSDLRGFTTLAERLPAQDLVSQLNEYLDRMVNVVFSTEGSIDKFIGDAVMAVWGRVREAQGAELQARDASQAIEAALRMREAMAELNTIWQARGLPTLAMGMGLNQGEAIVGNIGSAARMEFTSIGDAVNTTARLESLTKQYEVDLLVSQTMREGAAGHFIFRTVDLVLVKGKSRPVAVFSVLCRSGERAPSGLEPYELGIAAYRNGNIQLATAYLKAAAEAGLDDAITRIHRKRCEELLQNT